MADIPGRQTQNGYVCGTSNVALKKKKRGISIFFPFFSIVLVMCLGRYKIEEAEMFCLNGLEVCNRLLKGGYYMSEKRKFFF